MTQGVFTQMMMCGGQDSLAGNPGIYKWHTDTEKCLDFWARNNGRCENCARVCAFNKLPGKLHDGVRFLVSNAPWFDPLVARMDKLLGYGKRARTQNVWE
jgi:hypothetical protein